MSEPSLKPFALLVGRWTTRATHPAMPGVVVNGTVDVEWLEGERFLIHRGRTDHPDFPDSLSILGFTERDRVGHTPAADPRLTMHYFDSRGVFRIYEVAIDDATWRIHRHAPGFSQRFTGTFADARNTIVGLWQLCEDDVHWSDDLQITYHRSR